MDWKGKDFIKTKDSIGGFSNGNCRGWPTKMEEGFASCNNCGKRHYVTSDCKGTDFICDECKKVQKGTKFKITFEETGDHKEWD